LNLSFETSPQPSPLEKREFKIIKIPLSYIRNKIDWNFIKIKSWTWIIEKKVELWDINWNIVEVEKGLENIMEICK
jgi:hypothetical protein